MPQDILDVIKNLQSLTENDIGFRVLKDFERVIDELDIYVFKNWEHGELVSGPNIKRHAVHCQFMWALHEMPEPEGGQRLHEYGCQVVYKKDHVLVPRKIKDPSDFRPGTKKGKIDAHPVWLVDISIPKKLMQDVITGKENKDDDELSEFLKYNPISQQQTQGGGEPNETPL
jgi:hypothetical protein